MWHNLVSVLEKIMSAYRELLTLSAQKKVVVIAARIKDLEAIVKQEQLLIQAIGKLEQEREAVLAALLAEHHLQGQELAFSELVKHCDTDAAPALLDLQARIQAVLKDLAASNEGNTALIEQALQFVNFNINILSEAKVCPTYGAGQREATPPPVVNRAMFDQKI